MKKKVEEESQCVICLSIIETDPPSLVILATIAQHSLLHGKKKNGGLEMLWSVSPHDLLRNQDPWKYPYCRAERCQPQEHL